MVEFPFDLGKHLICQLAEIRAFRNVLAYQSVRVFVCTPLPKVVWACEVELGIESLGDLLMAGEFLSVVSRYRVYFVLIGQQRFDCRAGQRGGFFPSKPADQHQMRAPVVCRHDGPPAVLANHSVYLKFSKTLLLIYNRRPQRYVNPVLDEPPGPVLAIASSFTSTAMPEVTRQLVVATALLLPYPPVDCLRTYHLFPLQPEPAADLLRTVLAVDDEPSHGSFPLVGELQVVSPGLHPPFVLLLGQLPSVPMEASHIAVPANLTAHRACTDSDYFSDLPQTHLGLQQCFYRISLLPC